jgi:hypothetical protein
MPPATPALLQNFELAKTKYLHLRVSGGSFQHWKVNPNANEEGLAI